MSKLDNLLPSTSPKADQLLGRALPQGVQDDVGHDGFLRSGFAAMLQALDQPSGDAGGNAVIQRQEISLVQVARELAQAISATVPDEEAIRARSQEAPADHEIQDQDIKLADMMPNPEVMQLGPALVATQAPFTALPNRSASDGPSQSLPDPMKPRLDKLVAHDGDAAAADPSVTYIKVLHQEGHFSPVIREPVIAPGNPAPPPPLVQNRDVQAPVSYAPPLDTLGPKDLTTDVHKANARFSGAPTSNVFVSPMAPSTEGKVASLAPVHQAQLTMEVSQTADKAAQRDPIYQQAVETDLAFAGVVERENTEPAAIEPKVKGSASETGLPVPMLQKIAGVILAEANAAAAKVPPSQGSAATPPMLLTIKSSQGVIRVLNIQLHPVELGAVTVKMRLSGDKLEMELQTTTEEAANLLKNDSDKLGSLLRASGYQPEVITIQAVGVDGQSSSGQSTPRQHASHDILAGSQQSPDNSEGRQRRQQGDLPQDERRNYNDDTQEHAHTGRSAGSIYL